MVHKRVIVLISVFMISSTAMAGRLFFFTDAALKDTHDAFVDLMLNPKGGVAPAVCKDFSKMVEEKKRHLWVEVRRSPELKSALMVFSNLDLLLAGYLPGLFASLSESRRSDRNKAESRISRKKLRGILAGVHYRPVMLSFSDLSHSKRRDLLQQLLLSGDNFYRRLGFALKTWYTAKSYEGRPGACLSGIRERGDETASHLPKVPEFKTRFTYSPSQKRIREKADYIVIGSGAAASVVISGLQKAGKKVLVLEKGPMFLPGSVNGTDNFRFMRGGGLSGSANGGMFFLNGEVVGGGVTVNIDMSYAPTLPYIRKRFRSWHKRGLISQEMWSEDRINKGWKWVRKTFGPRKVLPEELNINNSILKSGAEALGLSWSWYELNTWKPGTSPWEVTDKKSSFETLILPSMTDSKSPATLLPDCEVHKIAIKNGIAKGVWFRVRPGMDRKGVIKDPYNLRIPQNRDIYAEADKVILAAGNMGSSVVLLNSKIKNPNIGRGFVSHPFMMVMGRFPFPVNAHLGTPSSVFVDHFLSVKEGDQKPGFLIEAAAGNPSAAAILMPGSPAQIQNHMTTLSHIAGAGVILVEDVNPDNRIEVDSKGRPRVHYALSASDIRRMRAGIAKTAEILQAAGAEAIAFNTYDPGVRGNSDDEFQWIKGARQTENIRKKLKLLPNQNLLMGAHMMAGNKLGQDPEKSVVGEDHQVWGVSGLYVVDASVFPESVGANPMQTIYTMARIFVVQHLKRN